MKCVEKVKSLPFIDALKGYNAQVYVVGGAVRDHFLSKESKDLDIMVCGMQESDLLNQLSKFGYCNEVGKSFGIIKWKAFDSDEEIDIGLPRRDRKGKGDKHTDIISVVDTTMKIEEELARRDFTINAMALDLDGKLIDPYGGLKDLADERIKMVNSNTFSDDPLRMLRAIQFASRFNFRIEGKTMDKITKSSKSILSISKERILIEFEKIVSKGNKAVAINYLVRSKMLARFREDQEDFYNTWSRMEVTAGYNDSRVHLVEKIDTMSEFLFALSDMQDGFKLGKYLGADKDTLKNLRFLDELANINYQREARTIIFRAENEGSSLLNSAIHSPNQAIWSSRNTAISTSIKEFKDGHFPKNMKELAVNGNDLMEWGYKGVAVGEAFKKIVLGIMDKKIENDKVEIKQYLDGLC